MMSMNGRKDISPPAPAPPAAPSAPCCPPRSG